MKQGMINTAARGDGAPDITVHIVGSNRLQNELVARFLEQQMAAACTQSAKAPLHSEYENRGSQQHLVLVDCQGQVDFNPWAAYDLEGILASDTCRLTFYNVHPDAGLEATAIESGVGGIFYSHESVKNFPKGLRAVLDGDMWYRRKVMADLLRSANGLPTPKRESSVDLTRREREILVRIAGGADNRAISEALYISPNTVKSHIYSLYKKINVKDRLQATLWAVKHL